MKQYSDNEILYRKGEVWVRRERYVSAGCFFIRSWGRVLYVEGCLWVRVCVYVHKCVRTWVKASYDDCP